MTLIVARKSPIVFKTQAIQVQASSEVLRYTPTGNPLSFAEMQQRRQAITIDNPEHLELTVANLGVSVDLNLKWQGREFQLLVRQDRPDRGDNVLKLLSGYVPAHELRVPLLTAMTEIAEELLIETESGWLQGQYQNTWLPTPYAGSLALDEEKVFRLTSRSGASRPVICRELNLLERPRAYVHLPSNSLQLVYKMQLELPESAQRLSLLHTDEFLDEESGELVAQMDYQRPELFLVERVNGAATGHLFTLQKGELIEQDSRDMTLSEAFAEQRGWVVEAPHCSWQEGLGER
ncbi:MAG TPA: metal ABC transporter ATPase [Pseudomonas sabulinigri]|uniref:Metal ABC transporter ATPase n=1 Tax=marine sediment metagenome TaxID=412755 RepID=A0A0F9XL02_9ZZZZ|nr:metal ABC transporter ATPase [Halopseudomonas sabulinigri]HEC50408.1 metal ABC transporter ATPase [Halopseudomonas sabulinigri]